MKKYNALTFIVLTFALTWSIDIPAALTRYGYSHIAISRGLQMFASLSPGVVAILFSLIIGGLTGLKMFLKPVLNWRIGIDWYLIVLGIGIVLSGLSVWIISALDHKQAVMPDSALNILAYLFILLFLSPFWEEIGWRGFLLLKLQQRFSALTSALIIGLVWGLWHLPGILAGSPYGDLSMYYFGIIFAGCFALSVIQTWLFNSTKSLLICILLHDSVNTGAAYFYGNLPKQELRPFAIFTALLIFTAITIIAKTNGRLDNHSIISNGMTI